MGSKRPLFGKVFHAERMGTRRILFYISHELFEISKLNDNKGEILFVLLRENRILMAFTLQNYRKIKHVCFKLNNQSEKRRKQMDRWNRIHSIGKKLIALLVVSFLILCVSVLSSTMLTTATFTTSEAGGIIQDLRHENGSNALWALIIPASFFIVISSRSWTVGKRDPDE